MPNSRLKIEIIKTSSGKEVSFCPKRGGIITSIKCKKGEIVYVDEKTLKDPSAKIRGGVPILFPNAGAIQSSKYPNLKQHGLARDSLKWKVEKTANGFKETLVADEETRKIFPYNFRLSLTAKFEKNGSFIVTQEVKNLEEKKELSLSMGLHPYFKVPQNRKAEIKFNFEGGKFIEDQVEIWSNGKFISIDNPRVKNPEAVMEIVVPLLGTIIIDASPEYKKIWIWSMHKKDFFCIEPVMRDAGGIVEDPEKIKPKETFMA